MQLSIRAICKLRVDAEADTVGRISDVLIDERRWAVRFLLLDAGSWSADRQVLISPEHLITEHWNVSDSFITTCLSQEAIEHLPGLKSDTPAQREFEVANLRLGSPGAAPAGQAREHGESSKAESAGSKPCFMRSWMEVLRYEVRDRNSVRVGKTDDFLVALPDWSLTSLAIDVGAVLNKRCIFVGVHDIDEIDRRQRIIRLKISREHWENTHPCPELVPGGREK